MQLVAHDGYALGRPKIDALEIRFVPDSNTLVAGLLAGALDATSQLGSIDAALQLREQWQAGTVLINFGAGTWTEIVPQLIDPNPAVISDLRFRTALAVGIDRRAITESIAGGFSPVPISPLNPNQPQYAALEASLPHFDYDPARAAQTLAEMGYVKGADGTLRDGAGNSAPVEVRSSAAGSEQQLRVATAIADDWQRLGIAAAPLRVPAVRSTDREYVAVFPGFYIKNQTIDVEGLRGYTSAATPLASNNFVAPTPPNASRYMSRELDDLISTYFRTIPTDERLTIMGRIMHILIDQVTMLGLYYNSQPGARSNRLIGAGPQWPNSSSFGWNAYEWDVE
jgi:peptide/nickel transport system substrate-binding protein